MSESVPTRRWCVYILRCSDGSLYAGSTNDLEARLRRHNDGRGAKYTAGRRPVEIAYAEECPSRSAAQSREAVIKRWPRTRKEALIGRHAMEKAVPGAARGV